MIPSHFLITVLILAVMGLISSKYNTRMAKGKASEVHSMWFLEAGFITVILFAIGSIFLGFNIQGLTYVLTLALACTVAYVIGVSVKHYYDDKQETFVTTRETSFTQTLQKELGHVTDIGDSE